MTPRSNASASPRAIARRRAGARRAAGFTMVELTVALMAGIIVAMGVVALSRDATNTFHDEARASVAEASLRAAMDRLRADLQRAGYMSTPNFLNDPAVAASPGADPSAGVPTTFTGITTLQSLQIAGSSAPPALSSVNAIDSDSVFVSGNMTVADQFDVAYIGPSAACQKIYLSPTSPAMYRLIGADGGTGADLTAAFQPASGSQFVVRLVDDSGKAQFLVTCGSGTAAGIDTTLNLPYVSVDTTAGSGTPLRTAQNTGTMASLTGPAAGRAWVNPVITVKWEIMTPADEQAHAISQYVNGLQTQTATGATDTNKYDLVRTIYDAKLAPIYSTSEVIAEYVADLRLALSVAGTAAQAPDPQATSSTITSYAFSDAANRTVAATIKRTGGGVPQRIRSIRARLVTRTAQADRTSLITPPSATNNTDGFLYRYCLLPGGCTSNGTTYQYARARTLTTEVALPNQQRAFY
jgi:type II secretory pathway pseudopilin PulG